MKDVLYSLVCGIKLHYIAILWFKILMLNLWNYHTPSNLLTSILQYSFSFSKSFTNQILEKSIYLVNGNAPVIDSLMIKLKKTLSKKRNVCKVLSVQDRNKFLMNWLPTLELIRWNKKLIHFLSKWYFSDKIFFTIFIKVLYVSSQCWDKVWLKSSQIIYAKIFSKNSKFTLLSYLL